MSNIIDGKETSASIKAKLQEEIAELCAQGHQPGLAVVLVGNDPASEVYVASKVKTCAELGMHSRKYALAADTSQEELIALIKELNADDKIHGILVQSPPPSHIDEEAVIDAIAPEKDVDGFHPLNVAKLALEVKDGFVPCTPMGCMELLKAYGISTEGKHAVVIGRSHIVGKPMAHLLMSKDANATVTVAHSRTKDLPALCRTADIIVAAVGRAEMVTADYVKDGAVIIDVGINRIDAPDRPRGYRIVGDVDFASVKEKCSYITPVPGGVGPMTIAMLMANTVRACRQQMSKEA